MVHRPPHHWALAALTLVAGCRSPDADRPTFIHAPPAGAVGITPSGTPYESSPVRAVAYEESEPASASPRASVLGSVPADAPWPLSLADARQLALENSKGIAVLGYVPRAVETIIATERAAFDPVVGAGAYWQKFDRQVANRIESFGSTSTTQLQEYFDPEETNQVYLEQRLASGGTVEIGHSLEYLRLRPVDAFVIVNPAYRSALNFNLEQPLFRGAGSAVTYAPLAIARANSNLAWHEFEAAVRTILRDVELAYWDVYRADRDAATRRRVVEQAQLTLDRERERLKVGEGSVPDVALSEEQYEGFRISMAITENERTRAERTLRRLMGLAPDDGRRIEPTSEPIKDAPRTDWESAVAYAQTRPEISAQYAAIEAAEMELVRARNGLLPDVSMVGGYAITGLADRYDDSWKVVGDNDFHDYTLGMVYRQALGRRGECAALRRAQLIVHRERARLDEVEHTVLHELHEAHREAMFQHDVILLHMRRLKAAGINLEARRALYNDRRATLDAQLEAEERSAIAALDETLALIEYQKALVRWNYASGALLEENVVLQEAPAGVSLPPPPAE